MSKISALDVYLQGDFVGNLTNVGHDRTLFTFSDDYIHNPNRATLSLGFKDALGGLRANTRPTQTRLIPFFSNLLPEGEMRQYLAQRAGVNPDREFQLIQTLGRDLPGAVQVVPSDVPLSLSIQQGKESENTDEPGHQQPYKFSLAGVQLKFSALAGPKGGMTIQANGLQGNWIVKLPSVRFAHVPENEFSMMSLARKLGMDVPELDLLPVQNIKHLPGEFAASGGNAFVIRRFDRKGNGERIHFEDFAQVFGVYPEKKYEKAAMQNIASVLAAEGNEVDQQELVRRIVFNTLIGNADMHLKNWSLIYRHPNRASIAPAYDFVSTIAFLPDTGAALKVSRSRKFSEFSLEELSHLANKSRLPERMVLNTAKDTVQGFMQLWQQEQKHLPLTSAMVSAINQHLKTIPIIQEC